MRVLFLSYNHNVPQLADSIQNHRLIEGLSESVKIEIISRKSISELDDIKFNINSPNLKLSDRILYKILPFLRTYFSLDQFVWSICAFFKIKKSGALFDTMISTYEPYGTRYLSKWLRKKKIVKKSISVFYDPCCENLFFNQSKIGCWLRARMESNIISISDYVVVNNKKVYNIIKGRTPFQHKLVLIPLCSKHYSNINDIDNHDQCNKTRVLHAGNIHGARNFEHFNEVLTCLKCHDPHISEKIVFDFYGDCPRNKKDVIIKSGNDDVVIFHGSVSQKELEQNTANADVLLLIDPMEGENYSFPSKLCEYFKLNKPIIALTSENSVSFAVLSESNHMVFNINNFMQMVPALLKILNHNAEYKFDKTYYKRFEIDEVADKFLRLL